MGLGLGLGSQKASYPIPWWIQFHVAVRIAIMFPVSFYVVRNKHFLHCMADSPFQFQTGRNEDK